jgi:hypothetical protein
MRNAYRNFVGNFEGRNYLVDLGLDGRFIVKCTLEK